MVLRGPCSQGSWRSRFPVGKHDVQAIACDRFTLSRDASLSRWMERTSRWYQRCSESIFLRQWRRFACSPGFPPSLKCSKVLSFHIAECKKNWSTQQSAGLSPGPVPPRGANWHCNCSSDFSVINDHPYSNHPHLEPATMIQLGLGNTMPGDQFLAANRWRDWANK